MAVEEFLQEDQETIPGLGREGKNWRGLEPGDEVLTTCDKTYASQRYLQQLITLVVLPDVLKKFSEIKNLFFLRGSVCDVSISWNYILLSVTDNFGQGNEPKLKETTVNYFEFRHHQSIEEYTRDNS